MAIPVNNAQQVMQEVAKASQQEANPQAKAGQSKFDLALNQGGGQAQGTNQAQATNQVQQTTGTQEVQRAEKAELRPVNENVDSAQSVSAKEGPSKLTQMISNMTTSM